MTATLRGISDIRHHFQRNTTPTYYIDETGFHLLGMDEWVRRFFFVTHADPFAGAHPSTIVAKRTSAGVFPYDTLEAMNNALLSSPAVAESIRRRGPGCAAMLYFDDETVGLCRDLDLSIVFPDTDIRSRAASKLEGARLADRAGVPTIPYVMGHVEDYEGLIALAGHLASDLVIQTAFGDSGSTTFFVSSAEDFAACASVVAAEPQVKVMKRIRCRSAAVEACITRCGTIVGPLLSEVIGFAELTPHGGGWAGNEAGPDIFPEDTCATARQYCEKIGDELFAFGYRGYFEVDILIDQDDGTIYFGEINARITGASSLTNLAAFAHADAPLFLFHLLEFGDVPFEVDVARINARWSSADKIDSWSQLIIKHIAPDSVVVGAAPHTGVWRLTDPGIEFVRPQLHRRTVDGDDEAFYFRIAAPGDVVHRGDDIGILVTRGRLQTPEHVLTDRARRWTNGVRGQYDNRILAL